MENKYKYDVALSFAEEDKQIAEQISESLKNLGLKPYYYEYETAQNWGENIFNLIIKRYKEQSLFALILISKHYVTKKWADIERQIIQTVSERNGKAYILPLRIDDTPVDGITGNILYADWKNNPNEIANAIKKKLQNNPSNFEENNNTTNSKDIITIKNLQGSFINKPTGDVFIY